MSEFLHIEFADFLQKVLFSLAVVSEAGDEILSGEGRTTTEHPLGEAIIIELIVKTFLR